MISAGNQQQDTGGIMEEPQERIMTPGEKLEAANKLLAYLDKEIPEKHQIEVVAIAIKAWQGSLCIKYDAGII